MWRVVVLLELVLDLGFAWAAAEDGSAPGPLLYPILLMVAVAQCVLVPVGLWLAPKAVDEAGRPVGLVGRGGILVLALGVPPIIWAGVFYLRA